MTAVKFDQVVESIPHFTVPELEQLQGMMSLFLSNGQTTDPSDDERFVLHAMSKRMEAEGLRFNIPYHVIRKSNLYSTWKTAIKDLTKFIITFQHRSKVRLSKNEYQSLLSLLFKLLIDDMRQIGIPITLKTLIRNMGRISEVFDKSFPGYLQSGMAYLVLTNIKRRNINSV